MEAYMLKQSHSHQIYDEKITSRYRIVMARELIMDYLGELEQNLKPTEHARKACLKTFQMAQ